MMILAFNCTKMRLAAGLRPDPLGELTAFPRPLSWILGGGAGKGGEGKGGGEGEAGGKERGEKGKESGGTGPPQ